LSSKIPIKLGLKNPKKLRLKIPEKLGLRNPKKR
jgi:hypothetical protein